MMISTYLSFSWLVVAFYVTQTKSLRNNETVFVFLLLNFINTNAFVLFTDNFGFVSLSKDPLAYVSFLLFQSLIIPALLLIFIDMYAGIALPLGKGIVIFAALLVFTLFEIMNLSFALITYKKWNFLSSIGYYMMLMAVGICSLHWYRRVCKE